MQEYTYYKTCFENNCELFGIDIFDYDWASDWEKVVVTDPMYGQEHTFTVWHVNVKSEIYTFAAGEFSNGVWGFYLPNNCEGL